RCPANAELPESLLVCQHEIEDVVDLVNGKRVVRAGTRQLGSVDRVGAGQFVKEVVLDEPSKRMQVDQCGPRPEDLDLQLDLVTPRVQGPSVDRVLRAHVSRAPAMSACLLDTGWPPRETGHQRLSPSYSDQRGLRCG